MSIRLSGLNSGMDTDAMVAKIMEAERMKLKKVEDKKTTLTWKQEKWKDLNTKLYSLYTKHISAFRFDGAYNIRTAGSTDEAVATVTAASNAVVGKHTLKVANVAKAQSLTGTVIEDEDFGLETNLMELGFQYGDVIKIKRGKVEERPRTWLGTLPSSTLKTIELGDESEAEKAGKLHKFEINEESTVGDFIKALKEAGLNAGFDKSQKRFYISSKDAGVENGFQLEQVRDIGIGGEELTDVDDLSRLGLIGNGIKDELASDAKYTLDGIEYTDSKNEVSVNGLNINLKGKTNIETTINVTSSVDELYKKFKGFLKEYNSVLKEMNDLFYAKYNKSYKPLTSQQKEKMSEKEIKEWDDKIKESLLRRDDKLEKVLRVMRDSMQGSIAVGNKNYALSSFGIMGSDYKERGLLHMYGDEDDGVFASKKDKFKQMFMDNPDDAAAALQGIMNKLYDGMTDAMKSTKFSSALTFYNDKEMLDLSVKYKKEYTTMEDKLNKIEDKYYKQFAAMEKAMSQLNSQTNSLASMLGK